MNKTVLHDIRFEPDLAGETVGWLATWESHRSGYPYIFLALGKVGVHGAHFEESAFGPDPNETHMQSQGFDNSVSLYTRIIPYIPLTPWTNNSHIFNSPRFKDFRPGTIYLRDSSELLDKNRPVAEQGQWITGNDRVVESLKATLKGLDAEEVYPALYYDVSYASADGTLLVDAEMTDRTLDEIISVDLVSAALEEARLSDEMMLANLNDHSNVPTTEIPYIFRSSRREVHELESRIQQHRNSSFMAHYVPGVGIGRTWPYMNADKDDEKEAFGKELAALKNNNSNPATKELEREIRELEHREEYASKIKSRVQALRRAEQAVLSA